MKKSVVWLAAVLIVLFAGGCHLAPGLELSSAQLNNIDRQIPVLMYHHFQKDVPPNLKNTVVTPEEFEGHLKVLKANGYSSISLYDYYKHVRGEAIIPQKPFIITMDDGYLSNYTEAFPLLKRYNVKADISIVTSTVGQTPGSFPHFTWEQAREMEASGLVTIYNHTQNHKICSTMTRDELIGNVIEAQNEIEGNLGRRKVRVFTYPEGKFTEQNRKIIQELGFDIQLTVNKGLINRQTSLKDINRINIGHGIKDGDLIELIHKLGIKED